MPPLITILCTATFAATALSQSSNNEFTNPLPKGSTKPIQTWIAGSTKSLTWNTDYDDVVVFLQSATTGDDGHPKQSITLLDVNSNFTTQPHPFFIGTNIDTSLSPFHFEVYQASTNNNFESQDVNILPADHSSSGGGSPSSGGSAATATVTRVVISALVENPPPSISPTTVTFREVMTESATVTFSTTVTATLQVIATSSSSGAKLGGSKRLCGLFVMGMAVSLSCVFV